MIFIEVFESSRNIFEAVKGPKTFHVPPSDATTLNDWMDHSSFYDPV